MCLHPFYYLYTEGNFCRNFIWDLSLTKLYANCLLSTLNSRASLQVSTRSTVDHHSLPRQMGTGLTPRRPDGGLSLEPMSPRRCYSRDTPGSGSAGSVKHFLRSYDKDAAKSFDRHSDMENGIIITKVRVLRFTNFAIPLLLLNCTGYRNQRGSASGGDSYTVTTSRQNGLERMNRVYKLMLIDIDHSKLIFVALTSQVELSGR